LIGPLSGPIKGFSPWRSWRLRGENVPAFFRKIRFILTRRKEEEFEVSMEILYEGI